MNDIFKLFSDPMSIAIAQIFSIWMSFLVLTVFGSLTGWMFTKWISWYGRLRSVRRKKT